MQTVAIAQMTANNGDKFTCKSYIVPPTIGANVRATAITDADTPNMAPQQLYLRKHHQHLPT